MIDRELLRKLRRIELRTSRLADDHLVGSYHSVFKGQGMTFREVRRYEPGDDVRFIDWNVSARMGELYVKVFVEERETTVWLVVDVSGSQRFGTLRRAKVDATAEMAALLAFTAIRNQDRVGLLLFTDRVERFVPPRRGRPHVLRVVKEVLGASPEGRGTRLPEAIERLGRLARRRAIVFVLSDFLDGGYEPSLRRLALRHDVVPIRLLDRRERDLPDMGIVTFEDAERGVLVEVDTSSRRVRAAWRRWAARRETAHHDLLRRLGIEGVDVDASEDPVPPLLSLFRRRERRLRRGR